MSKKDINAASIGDGTKARLMAMDQQQTFSWLVEECTKLRARAEHG
jgi:hypothetical protein